MRHGGVFTRCPASDDKVGHPREYAQNGEADAQQIVAAPAALPTHKHHEHGTGNAHEYGHEALDAHAFVQKEYGGHERGHGRKRGDEREVDGGGVGKGPCRERLRHDDTHQTAQHDDEKVGTGDLFLRHEQRNEPEDGGRAKAARGHIAHGRYPMIEKIFGDGDAESEDSISQ